MAKRLRNWHLIWQHTSLEAVRKLKTYSRRTWKYLLNSTASLPDPTGKKLSLGGALPRYIFSTNGTTLWIDNDKHMGGHADPTWPRNFKWALFVPPSVFFLSAISNNNREKLHFSINPALPLWSVRVWNKAGLCGYSHHGPPITLCGHFSHLQILFFSFWSKMQ